MNQRIARFEPRCARCFGRAACSRPGCVLPLEYFGREVGSRVLSVVWLVSTAAAAGPLLAGMIADRYGTFSPIFALFAVLLIVLSLALLNMRAPTLRRAPQK